MDQRITPAVALTLVLTAFWFAHYVAPSMVSLANDTAVAAGLALLLSLLALLRFGFIDKVSPSIKTSVRNRARPGDGESSN